MRSISASVVLFVTAGIIGGCGQSAVTTTVPATKHPSAPSLAPAHTAPASAAVHTQLSPVTGAKPAGRSAAAAQSVQRLLTQRTRRPPDVSAQYEFVGGAGPSACMDIGAKVGIRVLIEPFYSGPSQAPLGSPPGLVTYGQPVDVCFDGVGRGPLAVSVHGPQGFVRSGVFAPQPASYRNGSEWQSFDWVAAIEPSWPLGVYTVTASAGAIHLHHTFTVVPPSEPGVRVLGPSTDWGHNSVLANSHAKLFLTGFQHRSSVRLAVYEMVGISGRARFFSSATVPIPPSGNTMIEIPTGTGAARPGYEPTFIVTARANHATLSAAFSLVTKELPMPGLAVGSLPQQP